MADERPPTSLADTLEPVLARGDVTVRALLEAFGERAFGLFLTLLNLPSVFFAPPALAAVSVVPTALFGAQMVLGRSKPWLPAALLDRTVSPEPLRRVLRRAGPWLERLEAVGRPRLTWAAGRAALRVFGLFALVAALIILLPVPGTNVLPALSLVVLTVAVARRDGVLFLAGVAIGLAGALVALVAAGIAVELLRFLWARFDP
jgi:hypothetical protein